MIWVISGGLVFLGLLAVGMKALAVLSKRKDLTIRMDRMQRHVTSVDELKQRGEAVAARGESLATEAQDVAQRAQNISRTVS
ncbi:hypothetical protein [Haloglycomyces albus]|uniref:hypothetical protein n=1 Tax=Haloglycomyces albus TaxID=526067 RepID=UPI00046D53A7|nr:hypothetical protein [Haloglycomyces albus]